MAEKNKINGKTAATAVAAVTAAGVLVGGAFASPDDVLVALSTSGNSRNVVAAAKTAKAAGIRTLAVTGENESSLSALCDTTVKLPAHTPYAVQEYTLPLYHALCAALEAELFPR